jgi:hypothetical protein
MPSKQSDAIRKRWEAARLAMASPDGDGPDDESWGDLTAEPRGVDYIETVAGYCCASMAEGSSAARSIRTVLARFGTAHIAVPARAAARRAPAP